MTDEEHMEYHKARALLLGMDFRPLSHTYIKYVEDGAFRIDADTLERVPREEVNDRIDRSWGIHGKRSRE